MNNFNSLKDYFQYAGIEIGQGKFYEEMVYGIGLVYTSMIRIIEAYLNAYGLSPTDMNVLMLVKHQGKEKGISQVDLGHKLMVQAHNMTRAIQKLERKGFLKRVTDKYDARVNRVIIAAKGSLLLDEIWPGYHKTLHSLANKISMSDQKTLACLLQKWLSDQGE